MKTGFVKTAVEEVYDIIDDGINWCLFHSTCVAMAVAFSYVWWICAASGMHTTSELWGNAQGDPSGVFQVAMLERWGIQEPWLCCLVAGILVTVTIGALRIPFGFVDSLCEGHLNGSIGFIGAAKNLMTETHLTGLGLTTGIAAVENIFGAGRAGESFALSALVGWGYLRPMIQFYQTPIRYVLNALYGGAVFCVLFPFLMYGTVGVFDSVQHHSWGWAVWALLLGVLTFPIFGMYCQAAWQQGYGLGLWLGSWMPPRGWQLRKIYRLSASYCYRALPQVNQ